MAAGVTKGLQMMGRWAAEGGGGRRGWQEHSRCGSHNCGFSPSVVYNGALTYWSVPKINQV